jgi:hypothetical protein
MFEKGYFSLGVRIVSAYPLAFILGGAVLFFLSGVTLGILSGPCLFGLAYMTRRAMRGEEVTLADIFSGFEERIGSAFIAGIALLGFVSMTAAVFLPIGAPIFNIPGFVVFAILGWMFPILVDDETARFRDAFVRAFEFSEKELLQRGLFALVLVAVGGAGFLPFVPGVAFPLYLLIGLVTDPVRRLLPGDAPGGEDPPPGGGSGRTNGRPSRASRRRRRSAGESEDEEEDHPEEVDDTEEDDEADHKEVDGRRQLEIRAEGRHGQLTRGDGFAPGGRLRAPASP